MTQHQIRFYLKCAFVEHLTYTLGLRSVRLLMTSPESKAEATYFIFWSHVNAQARHSFARLVCVCGYYHTWLGKLVLTEEFPCLLDHLIHDVGPLYVSVFIWVMYVNRFQIYQKGTFRIYH